MDTFTELGVFTRVVDLGGFTRAAASLGLTPSGVSRIVSRLEERLGAAYHERCTRILADVSARGGSRCRAPASARSRAGC